MGQDVFIDARCVRPGMGGVGYTTRELTRSLAARPIVLLLLPFCGRDLYARGLLGGILFELDLSCRFRTPLHLARRCRLDLFDPDLRRHQAVIGRDSDLGVVARLDRRDGDALLI